MRREQELATAYLAGRLHRRDLIRIAAATGASLPLTTFLIACGGGAPPAATPAATAARPTTGASATGAPTAATGSAAPTTAAGSAPAATAGPVVTGATVASQPGSTAQASGGAPKSGGTLLWSFPVSVADTLNQHISNHTISRMVARHVLDSSPRLIRKRVRSSRGSRNPGRFRRTGYNTPSACVTA